MDETWKSELGEFIAIPSVSADPAHREDVKRAGSGSATSSGASAAPPT